MLQKLKNFKQRLASSKNAKTVAHMNVLQECSVFLDAAKARMQLAGVTPTWANFQQTTDYAEYFAGINTETIEIARKLWEEIKA